MSEEKVLPPFVYGKLRGHLTVKVTEIFWVKNNPGNIFVELLWWGEKESHIFRPSCINRPSCDTEEHTSITFNIRTSILLFENYIKKSGKLVFGIFKYPSKEHLGDVTVWNPFKAIFSGKFEEGYYPIFNSKRIRIGDLRISFELWMSKKDNSESISDIVKEKVSSRRISRNMVSSSSSTAKDVDEIEQDDPLYEVLNRGKDLRDAMTMSVLDDVPIDNIEKVISNDNHENFQRNKTAGQIDANKLMDFLMGKELPPEEEVLAIKTLRSVSPTQSVVNQELKSRVTSSQSCRCCFKNNNSCSSCNSRSSNLTSSSASRPQTSSSTNIRQASNEASGLKSKTKHVIELVNCYKLMIQCLHLNSLGVKKVKGTSSKSNEKVKRKPGLYYMIEHLPGSQTNINKDKPWNLKQTRFVSRKINNNEIEFGESNFLVEPIDGSFSWPKILKQLDGTSLKIYWRYHNQRLPCYLGASVLKDDSVNPSGLFSTFTLPVNSNSGITVGHLSLLLELGHNRKTFGNHLLSFDHFKESDKDLDKEDILCECSGCRVVGGGTDRYDTIWGRDMENRARDMMISSHNRCCQSSRNKNPPTRTSSSKSNTRVIESQVKSHSESQKLCKDISSDNSTDDKVPNKEGESSSNGNKLRLVDIPSNIPDELKSSESSDSTSIKSDYAKEDLRLDAGNLRPRCVMNDASCQVTLDRSSLADTKRDSPSGPRLCKSCLVMSDHKPSYYSVNSNPPYNADVPNWSKTDRFYQIPIYGSSHRETVHYPPRYQSYPYRPSHSCHCCPSEFPNSHKCCYEMASAQLNTAHFNHNDYITANDPRDRRIPSPSLFNTNLREPPQHPLEPASLHELSISVDRILDFPMFNQDLNEEADCFVDYTFPTNQNNKIVIPHRRYATEVCVISKEVTFSTVTKHTLMLPSMKNLNEVFDSLAFHSVDFNVWCRLYRSTPVDHVIAKAILPIGRICALKQEFDELGGMKSAKDKVCLPLLTVASPLSIQYPTKISGTMEVTLIYKNFDSDRSTINRSTLDSNYSSNRRQDRYGVDHQSGHPGMKSADHCCNNINYNTIPRTLQRNTAKMDPSGEYVSNEPSSRNNTKERLKEDRALSPIQEISVNSNPASDQIENLRQSLERLVAEAEDINTDLARKTSADNNSDSSLDAYLEKSRNVVQVESSSDDGLESIVPNMKPNLKQVKKSKNHSGTNQPSLSEYQTSKKGNTRSGSLNSENIMARLQDNFEDNGSDNDTLKSVSSVNSDDSSSHVGFIAFNKDFVKNDCSMKKRKETQKPTTNLTKPVSKAVTTKEKSVTTSKCTQTADILRRNQTTSSHNPKSSISLFKVKIEVERAINLPLLAPYGSVDKQKPSSYVSFDAYLNGNSEHVTSEIIYNSTDPVWNAAWTVMLPTEYLYKCDKKLMLNVMLLSQSVNSSVGLHVGQEENRTSHTGFAFPFHPVGCFEQSMRPKGAVRKQALIDLTSLSAGLPLLLGWYSLVNESTSCSGQIKIKITPLEDISKHKDIWFKEYSVWEKDHHRRKSSSNNTVSSASLKDDPNTVKIVPNEQQISTISPKKVSDKNRIDPIDRDLVYISLNQKLSELDKIPGYFKDKNSRSSEYSQPSCSKNFVNSSNQESIKDLMDLGVDKDISYVNKLLSEIPKLSLHSRSSVNFIEVEEPVKSLACGSTGLKRPQDFMSVSFNASDILDLEEIRRNEKLINLDQPNLKNVDRRDMTSNFGLSNVRGNNIIEVNTSESKSDESKQYQTANAEHNQSSYQSFSPDLSIDNITKSGSLNLPSECLRQDQCGSDQSTCIFNNKTVFPNMISEQREFTKFSPELSIMSKSSSALVNSDAYSRMDYRPSHSELHHEKLEDESEETENLSKELATLSGQSSLCTDDQSLNVSDQLPSQEVAYSLPLSDYHENLNSDLMEEASSEIDRILRELNKQ